MGRMHDGAHADWKHFERSAQWLEMLWRRNDFIVWRFSPNTASHSKIDCCRQNKRLPQIIKTVALCEKLQLKTNMRVALLNNLSAEDFSKQLLTISNGCVRVNESSGLISFPWNFCNFVSSKDELINKVFPHIIHNNKNHKWLSERAILMAKNKYVDDLNFVIHNQIVGTLQ